MPVLKRCPRGSLRDKKTKKCVSKKTKRCPRGSRRDPLSGECVSTTKVTTRCPRGSRKDPLTGECVSNKTVKTKTKVVKSKKTVRVPEPLPSTSNVEQKPVWCMLDQTTVRKAILDMGLPRDITMNDIPTPENPNRLCEAFGDIIGKCVKGWKIVRLIASGATGTVFETINEKDNSKGVMKMQYENPEDMKREIDIQRRFHKLKLSPKLHGYCSFKPSKMPVALKNALKDTIFYKGKPPTGHKIFLLFMDSVDGTVMDWFMSGKKNKGSISRLVSAVIDTVDRLKKAKVVHGDFHLDNMGYVYTDSSKSSIRILPIDFGWSSRGRAFTEFELILILETSQVEYRDLFGNNASVFSETLIKAAKSKFGIVLPSSTSEIHKKYNAEFKKYEKYWYSKL